MKGLFLFSLFTIIYGSLFPFEFEYIDLQTQGKDTLLATSFFDGRLADILGNIVLFMPFGFAGSELISRHNKNKAYYLFLYGFGFILALTLQIIQLYLPSRVPALYDAAWNLCGIFVGDILARFIKVKYNNILKSDDRLALLGLLTTWIIFLLSPFVFSFDTELIKESLTYYLDPNEYRFVNVLLYIFLWVSFSNLLDELVPVSKNIFISLEFIFLITIIGKEFVYRNIIEPEIFLGGVCAIILVRSGIFKKINPYKISAICLIFAMFYNSLYPFEFYHNPFKEFMWVPFAELFSDDMIPIIRTVFYKTFIYGCILWNLYKGFPNSNWVPYFCVIYAASIEYFQHLTLFRVGGLTEPLLVIFLICFIKQKREVFNLYEEKAPQ